MSDFDQLSASLSGIAAELAESSERITAATAAAHARTFDVDDPDGLAGVTVDGRPRVLGLDLHPDVLRHGPDAVDGLLTDLLNDALGLARAATREAALGALPGPVRADAEAGLR